MLDPVFAPPDREDGLAVGDLMVVLGDSLAVGIGAGHVAAGCMAQVAAALAVRHPRMVMANFAVPSEDSTSMLAAGGQLDRAIEAITVAHLAGERVGPVTLSLGANDSIEAATLGEDEALRRFAANLGTILGRLAEALAAQGSELSAVMCMQTFYNPFTVCDDDSALPTADELAPRRSRRHDFNAVIRSAAVRYGVAIADVAAAFRGRELELTWLRSGDIHPNQEGQEVIRDQFLAAVGLG